MVAINDLNTAIKEKYEYMFLHGSTPTRASFSSSS